MITDKNRVLRVFVVTSAVWTLVVAYVLGTF